MKRILAATLALVSIVTGCGHTSRAADERIVTPDNPRTSPSGAYTAYATPGPEENSVKTWVVVIRDKSGKDVFHDDYAYSTRHGVMITWLSTEPEQLWVYSGDVAVQNISPGVDGAWTKTAVKRDNVPSEITELWRPS